MSHVKAAVNPLYDLVIAKGVVLGNPVCRAMNAGPEGVRRRGWYATRAGGQEERGKALLVRVQ